MSGFGTLAFGLLVFSHSDNKRMCGGKIESHFFRRFNAEQVQRYAQHLLDACYQA